MAFKPLSCVFGGVTIPQRYVLVFMLQLALLNAYNLRVVLNIAMTEILEPRNHTEKHDACPEYTYTAVDVSGGKYQWPPSVEAFILYAFYIGYLFTHIPGGWLADKLGGRHVMGICMVSSATVTLLYPLAIEKGGYIAAIALRVMLGLTQGPLLPTISTFIQCWIPAKERAFLGGIAFGGSNMGSVIGNTFTGIIIKRTESWAMPFYIWAACTYIWYAFYFFMVFSRPSSHPYITEKESELLEQSVEKRKHFVVPWWQICKSAPVWALLAGQFAHNYIFFTVMTDLPKYLKEILKMEVQSNAIATSMPFLALWISNIVFAFISDFLTNRGYLTILTARRLWTAFSVCVPSSILVVAVYVGCNRMAAISLYTLALFLIGPFFSGMKVNVNDLTTHYGGTIMAIVNGLGSIAGILGPFVVGWLTPNESLEEWHLVFWVMLCTVTVLAIIYVIFARAERLNFDFNDDEDAPDQ